MESPEIHLFETIEAAQEAVNKINTALGIPKSPQSVTRTYCEVMQQDDLIFIFADETTKKILGETNITL